MLDQLMNMLQNSGKESVIDNPQVPNEHNDGVLQSAGSSIFDSVKNMMANGQISDISQLASNPAHPASQQIQSNFIENITSKFGIDGAAAQNIASQLIPGVLAKIGGGAGNGGFDISSLTSSLGQLGLDKDKDGDVDLNDVKNMLGF